ncbi:MAG: sulfatase, partial [Planctomycetota bacterium]
ALSGSLIASSQPHIVLIVIDDLGARDLSCTGSNSYHTPHIDHLASQGMLFSQGYAAAANCAPSRACLMSGQATPRHGVYTVKNSDRGRASSRRLIPTPNTPLLKDDITTLATCLQNHGYHTVHLGKWHVTADPLNAGFTRNYGGSAAGSPSRGGYLSPYHYPNVEATEPGRHLCEQLTDLAIAEIAATATQPLFMHLAYYSVHTPLQAPAERIAPFTDGRRQLAAGQNNATYAAMIDIVDEQVGRLLAALDHHGLSDQTIVIFTSDNGGVSYISDQAPLRAGKGSYYEGGTRVPFIVRWPGITAPASTCPTPVSGLDIFPTLINAATINAPHQLDGTDISPLLHGQPLAERALIWHFPIYLDSRGAKKDGNETREYQDPLFRTRPGSSIRRGQWKLIEYFELGELELYNLEADPGETTNLAEREPSVVAELLAELNTWRQHTQAPVPSEANPAFTSAGATKQKN